MVTKPKGANSSNPRKDSRAIPNNTGAGSASDTGTGSAGTGSGVRDRGTGPQDVDAQGATNAPPVVRFGGIPFDSPEYNQTPPGLLDGFPTLPDPPIFEETPLRYSGASKSRGKKASAPASNLGVPTDPDTTAAFVLLAANSAALNVAGADAGMRDEEYAAIHKPLSEIIRQSKYADAVAKVSAPAALLIASLAWLARVATVYREKHPQKPRTTHVTPKPETRASATVTETPDLVEPAISENGMQPEELAGLASVMGM